MLELKTPVNDSDVYETSYYEIDDHSGLFTLTVGFLAGAATVVFCLLAYVWIFT